jgi:hypothetical protein
MSLGLISQRGTSRRRRRRRSHRTATAAAIAIVPPNASHLKTPIGRSKDRRGFANAGIAVRVLARVEPMSLADSTESTAMASRFLNSVAQ